MSLLNLPVEVLDNVASHIDPIQDLLNLALSCRALSRIVPSHLHYRTLACNITSPIWKHLLDHPSLARKVRTVKLIPFDLGADDVRFDPTFHLPLTASAASTGIKDFCLALAHMHRLRRFVYRLPEPPPDNEIWWTLKRCCPDLKDLEVADAPLEGSALLRRREAVAGGEAQLMSIHDSAIFELGGLERFVFYSSALKNSRQQLYDTSRLARLESMLTLRCPDLVKLRLCYTYYDSGDFSYAGILLSQAQRIWPQLRTLELGTFYAGDEQAVASFFEAHSAIEELYLDQGYHSPGTYVDLQELLPAALPRLTHFHGGIDNVITVLSGHRPIVSISGLRFHAPLDFVTSEGQQLLHMLGKTTSLRRLDIDIDFGTSLRRLDIDFGETELDRRGNNMMQMEMLFRACANLEELCIRGDMDYGMEVYAQKFTRLPRLRHIRFVDLWRFMHGDFVSFISAIANFCLCLETAQCADRPVLHVLRDRYDRVLSIIPAIGAAGAEKKCELPGVDRGLEATKAVGLGLKS